MTTYQFTNLALFGGPWGTQRDNPKYTRLLLFAWWKIEILTPFLCSWFDIYERGLYERCLPTELEAQQRTWSKRCFHSNVEAIHCVYELIHSSNGFFYEVRIMIWIFLKLKSKYLSCPAFSGVGYRIVHEAHQGLGGWNLLINIF